MGEILFLKRHAKKKKEKKKKKKKRHADVLTLVPGIVTLLEMKSLQT